MKLTRRVRLPDEVELKQTQVDTRSGPKLVVHLYHKELNQTTTLTGYDLDVLTLKIEGRVRTWDVAWTKLQAANREQQTVEEKISEAAERTRAAQESLARIQGILKASLDVGTAVDWERFEKTFDKVRPSEPEELPLPAKPSLLEVPPKPVLPELPPEPSEKDGKYQPIAGFRDLFSNRNWGEKRAACRAKFEADHEKWEKLVRRHTNFDQELSAWEKRREGILRTNEERLTAWELEREEVACKNDARRRRYQEEIGAWEAEQKRFEENALDTANALKEEYLSGSRNAVVLYCNVVLENSSYPEYCPQEFDLDFVPDAGTVVVDYLLPSPDQVPMVKEVAYVRKRDDFVEKELSQTERSKLYDALLYQIALRTVHELYDADLGSVIKSIVFNGWVESIDKATGKSIRPCIMSLQAGREEFQELDLLRVDPKACFKALKGVASSKLHALAPVAPIARLEREDDRFVDSYEVVSSLDVATNLAAMNWEDFEHLIRELFESEFSERGAEVRVTQASRDRGVDAVVFDPDPISGGKIIIQAKRYTNVVGAAAVRELLGTVQAEGANKGILVTTSDFGPDAYKWAKGKPLTLLNGGNLLHLLAKHGHRACIDLQEAKKILAEEEKDLREGN
ncbi:restriction endonuclease [Candidatus Bipolaricaulota bacterium]|nr:restriction endonuclease [Candidatus Bipolaricaulota bacterium]